VLSITGPARWSRMATTPTAAATATTCGGGRRMGAGAGAGAGATAAAGSGAQQRGSGARGRPARCTGPLMGLAPRVPSPLWQCLPPPSPTDRRYPLRASSGAAGRGRGEPQVRAAEG
jgi:hypothetical protein